MIIDNSIKEICPEMPTLDGMVKVYANLKEFYFSPIKAKLEKFAEEGRSIQDVIGKHGSGFGIFPRKNIPQKYQSCLLFWEEADWQELVDTAKSIKGFGEEYFIGVSDDITKKLVEHRSKKIRKTEAAFFSKMLQRRLGEDFKGIFLFSCCDPVIFHMYFDNENLGEIPKRLGNWDYADIAYAQEPQKLNPEMMSLRKGNGLLNPELIPAGGEGFVLPASNYRWELATSGNKTTRLVHWSIGDWPLRDSMQMPKEIVPGSYDVVFFQSDCSGQKCAPALSIDLAKEWGFIVTRPHLAKLVMEKSEKIKPLLVSDALDYNLLQKQG